MISVAQITCPHCKHLFDWSMSPYDNLPDLPCPSCGKTIAKNPNDHCAVCSHGSVMCLAQQSRRDCCSG